MNVSAPASVTFRSVGKQYGAVRAVDGISFTIDAGTLVTLLGPSGCGKTTTLRLIAGLEMATSGQILIGEEDVTLRSAADRDVSMVFQSYALFPHMSVFENVAYGPTVQRMPKAQIREVVHEKLSLVGLAGLENRSPSELSGGQQQRVAVARALVMEPQVLLFDEPLSNLDIRRESELLLIVNQVVRSRNVTALLIAHHINPLLPYLDRVVYIANGKVATGKPSEVLTNQSLTALYGIRIEVLHDSRGNLAIVGLEDTQGEHEY